MKYAKSLCIIISIILLWWIYYLYISPYIFKEKIISVPNIIGYSEDDAIRIINDNNLKYNINYVSGDTNSVISIFPNPNTSVYQNSVIDIYIERKMPSYYQSFLGLVYDNNINFINDYCNKNNITYEILYEVNNNYPKGVIFRQSKDENELINENDSIIFYVALNDEYFKMPNLIGMNIYDAIELLDMYNLKYNIIYQEFVFDENIIIYQSVLEGVILKKGNNHYFNIYVSK